MDKRPRRSTTQKKSDFNEGLLWQEERELTRALYASLQRPRSEQDEEQQEILELAESKEPENQVNGIPLDLPDLQLGAEQRFVDSPSACIGREAETLLIGSHPQRLSDTCISEQLNGTETVDSPVVDNSVVDHSVLEDSVSEHPVVEHPAENHTVLNHSVGDIVHSQEPLNITDPDHNDIQEAEAFHDLNSTINHPQTEQHPVKKRSPKPKDPTKPKGSPKRKEPSTAKDLSKSKKSPKVDRSSKPKGLSKSKQSVEPKKSHKKKVLPDRLESSKVSKARLGSAKSSKREKPRPIITRSRSPKASSPRLLALKPKQVSKDSTESIARRLRTSASVNSGNAMGNVLGRPSRSQERKQNSEANGVNKAGPDESKNSSGDFLPPAPPLLPPPLIPPQKHKLNAAVLSKQSTNKRTGKKCFAISRDRSSAKAKRVPSVNGKNPKLNPIPKRPLRSLRRDLRSRSKFKMPQAGPLKGPTTRRSTRSQNTSSSSSSSGLSSNNDSQDETKSTSSSSSSGSRVPKPRKAKERLVTKRKSDSILVSSTSGEDEDTKGSKPKKAKVQAQRKFAYPQAYSPGCTPSKMKNGDMMSSSKSFSIFNHCPSTEDFLTFLCLRGTPALPPSLDLFKVQSKPIPNLLQSGVPKQLAGRKRSATSTFRSEEDIDIPGIEPLPRDDSAPATPTLTPPRGSKTSPPRLAKTAAMTSPSMLQQKRNMRERRLRLDARHFKASGKLTKNLRNSFKSNQNNILGNGPQQLPPNLSPVPPPILAIQRSRHPPPLIPIVPWENKRCQTNNHHSTRNAAQTAGRKTSSVRPTLTRSSGRSSTRNCVPSKNNIVNHRLDKHEDQSPIIATSKAKNSGRRRDNQRNNHKNNSVKQGRISKRLKNERCQGEVINGANHILDKIDGAPNGHTLLNQIKLLKGPRRERKEKKCSCHSQNCSQRTRSRHKNGDRDLAFEGAIEEVLKSAKRQKKLKDLKRRSSRKLRNSSMMLRDRVQSAEVELDDAIEEKADVISTILKTTNGISKKLTIPLTNCTLNNNVLRKDSMICPKAHLNHEIERKLNELKIKEDEEEEDSSASRSNKIRNPLLLKNHKELLPSKLNSETTLQRLQKKAQGQALRRNRAKTKNGLAPFKSSKEEVQVQAGPSKFLDGVKEGLVLRPSAEEWSDPMAYMESISDQLNEYGMCRVIPPEGWKPECKLHANTRFTTEVQYIHRLMHRWKSRSKQLACIKRHLEEREKVAYYPPQISGYEIDLVEFSQVVAQQGGLKTITNNKRWNKVADLLHIPKAIQGRVKLDSIYCKFLLSFDTLSKEDKQRLEMDTELLIKQQVASRLRSHENEYSSSEEVVCKGRPTTLSAYSRMASLTQQMLYTRPNPPLENIEDDYWKMLDKGQPHVAVHTGHVNATLTARHNWNCKNIGKNPSNILHLLPNNLGVNMPLMKIAMMYGSEGWSVDSQGLSQIEYLHTGSPKIWYGVPASHCNKLEELLQSEVPDLCTYQQHCLYRNNLHCMAPPSVLACKDVPVYRLVQEPGEFVIVAQGAARANLCTGYSTSEAIPFASASNVHHCLRAFEICQELKQATLFSVEHLLCVLTLNAAKIDPNLLRELQAKLVLIRDQELSLRQQLSTAGLKSSICFADSETCEDGQSFQAGARSRNQHASDKGCHVCRQPCYLSMVVSEREDRVYCLHHAYQMITKTKMSGRNFKLLYRYSASQLRELVDRLNTDANNHTNLATSSAMQPSTAATKATTISQSSETEMSPDKGSSSSDLPTTSTAPLPPSPPSPQPQSPQLPPPPATSLPLSMAAETIPVVSEPLCSSSASTSTSGSTTSSSSPSESRLRKKAER